jgi:hypothetical protein
LGRHHSFQFVLRRNSDQTGKGRYFPSRILYSALATHSASTVSFAIRLFQLSD